MKITAYDLDHCHTHHVIQCALVPCGQGFILEETTSNMIEIFHHGIKMIRQISQNNCIDLS